MFRIKDDIDLKILENKGFIKDYSGNGYTRIIEKDNITKQCYVYFSLIPNPIYAIVPKILYLGTPLSITIINEYYQWVIEDLIKDDLVEKLNCGGR